MNISSILESGHPIQVVINAADLKEAFLAWCEKNAIEEWLPTSIAVKKYQISKQTLNNYRKHGYLHPVRRGVEMHYRLSELSKIFGE